MSSGGGIGRMNRISTTFAAYAGVILAVWLVGNTSVLSLQDSRVLGVAFTQLTGILLIAMMSFSNLLSMRPRWLEPTMDGLDKMYRLHKWLGIVALALGIVHWLTATGGQRGNAANVATGLLSSLQSMHGIGKGVGQAALFVLIALVGVALIKAIP